MFSLKKGILGVAICFFLLISTASAFSLQVPDYIAFNEEPKIISFEVQNSSDFEQELQVQFFGPIQADFLSQLPTELLPNQSITVRMRLIPEVQFVGSEYSSSLSIRIGEIEEKKSIRLSFEKRNTLPVQVSVSDKLEARNGIKAVKLTVKLRNSSIYEQKAEIEGVSGIPEGWKTETEEKSITLSGAEEKTANIWLIPNSDFKGNATVKISSLGFEEEASTPIDFKAGTGAAGAIGFFSLGKISFDAAFWLNAFLVVIAAILLIAFIARFLRRVN